MEDDFKRINKKMNDMDKYYKEARDLEVKGNLNKAKASKEKAQDLYRDVQKGIRGRIEQNKKI